MWKLRNNEYRVYIPYVLQTDVIKHFHYFYIHPGMSKMIQMLQWFFNWPNLFTDVYIFIKNCDECNLIKTRKARLHGPLKSIITTKARGLICVNYFGKLPVSRFGCDMILVVVDHFSKYTKLYPLRNASADNTIIAVNKYIKLIGGPIKKILLDNGPQFSSNKWRTYWKQ